MDQGLGCRVLSPSFYQGFGARIGQGLGFALDWGSWFTTMQPGCTRTWLELLSSGRLNKVELGLRLVCNMRKWGFRVWGLEFRAQLFF